MEKQDRWQSVFTKVLGYILVAAVASAVTFFVCQGGERAGMTKLDQLEVLLEERFIGETDLTALENAAAEAMVNALGDRWSYYMTAQEYEDYVETMNNAYVGIGVTVAETEDGSGFLIEKVEEGGGAQEAGLLTGDLIIAVEGRSAEEIGLSGMREQIRGEEGTKVTVTILREGTTKDYTLTRKTIQVPVATGKMLPDNIGLVTISNFDSRCADETIAAIEKLRSEGATALIFDVRYNPGSYKSEMVELLDYLLPKGTLFRSENYAGQESVDTSDAKCLDIPMAVLVNGSSYSAAEFFAAALSEYD